MFSFRYVNYGRVEDIKKLDELGVSLKGRIAISRSKILPIPSPPTKCLGMERFSVAIAYRTVKKQAQ